MEGLKDTIMAVCVVSAAICIIDGLAAGTRFRKQMRFLLNLIFVLIVVSPILKGTAIFEMPDISGFVTSDYNGSQEVYYEQMKQKTGENISSVLEQQLEAAGINCESIETDVNISESNSISISSVTVCADNFTAAAEIVRNSLGTETEVIDGNM